MSEVETNEEVVEVTLSGLAAKINTEVLALTEACCIAIKLEGGLDTAAGIRKESVSLRTALMDAKDACHKLYQETLVVRDGLIGGVAVVKASNAKDALKAKIAEDQAKLDAM